ncbi:MAG: MerR family transcriptional regulator [Christensenellaceae bacterium]|jgi:DNA-binding transcriptional MerR regulator|nr:MerR family transcriptional regulator [Christensenellaceae bacterium]
MYYTIGEAAQRMHLSAPTLRYYDKEGLLPFVDRSAGGARMFKESDFEWLRLIECLKSTGMPIRDIKQFIDWYMEGDTTLPQRRDMFYERRRAVEAQIETLQATLDMIDYKCWYYDTAVAAGSSRALQTLKPEELPEEVSRLKARIAARCGS